MPSAAGVSNAYGIYLTGSDFNIFKNNTISTTGPRTGNSGIYLVSSTNNNITENNISANGVMSGNTGITLINTASFNSISNNNISANGTSGNYGIFISTASNNTITQNKIYTNGTSTTNYGIYTYLSANNNDIFYNNISAYGTSSNFGIYLYTTADGNDIIGNNVLANGSLVTATTSNYGIALSTSCYNNNMENNTVITDGKGRYNHGIYLSVNSNFNTIIGNNVTTNGTGITNAGAYLSESRDNLIEDNIISTYGSTTSYGIYLESNARRNLVKSNNISTSSGTSTSHGIYLVATAPNYPHDNTFDDNNFISIMGSQLYVATAGINDIHLRNQNISTYYFTGVGSLVSVENLSSGKINFLQSLTGTTQTDFSNRIIIRDNYAYINETISGLNKSAEITIYNLPTSSNELRILRNGGLCSAAICTNLTSMQAGNVTFNVTMGGNYSITQLSSSPSIEPNLP